jgi:hypothetical protein
VINMTAEEKRNQIRKDMYQELCQSYHQIDDFRAKLLAALPVASAGGAFFLIGGKLDNLADGKALAAAAPLLTAVGAFGATVTVALLCYEIYGIMRCGALINAGISLEQALGVNGQFISRPNEYINEPFAAAIIYPAVVAGWSYLALFANAVGPARWIAAAIFLAGFLPMVIWDIHLVRAAKDAEERRKNEAPRDVSGHAV